MDEGAARRAEFETAYRRLYQPICGYVLRRVSEPEEAAEVVAETFLTLWRRWQDAPGGDSLRPWLFGVARRILSNQRRGERRRNALAQRLVDELAAVERQAAAPESGPGPDARVAEAFAELSDSDRELLSLLAWEGLSRPELAVALGVSRATVRLRLHRARSRFAAGLRRRSEPGRAEVPAPAHAPQVRRCNYGPEELS